MFNFLYLLILTIAVFVLFLIFLAISIKKSFETTSLKSSLKILDNKFKALEFDYTIFKNAQNLLGNTINIRKTLDKILPIIAGVTKYSVISYLLVQKEKILFRALVTEKLSGKYIENLKLKIISDFVSASKKTENFDEIEEDITGEPLSIKAVSDVKSFFSLPVSMNGTVVAIINVSSINEGLYKEEDLKTSIIKEVVNLTSDCLTKINTVVEHEKGKLEVMIEGMNDGVLMTDRDMRILFLNSSFYRLLGFDIGTSILLSNIDKYFLGVFPFQERILHVLSTGESLNFEGIKVGDRIYQLIFMPARDDTEIIGVGAIIRDQTKDEELKKLRAEFTAMMVHELRSPITVIKGTADLLLTEAKNLSAEQITGFITQIKDSSSGLLGIVNDILDAAKIESGKIELFKRPCDFNKLLNDEYTAYSNLATQKGIKLQILLDDSIPKMIPLDEKKIKQVMNNLLSNALKFTENDGEIVIASRGLGNEISVSVSDTGNGIPDEVKSQIFQKFTQARDGGEQPNEKGTGLGLAISKGVIDAHGGKIWIEDNHPRGARFIFTIPVG